MYMKETVEFEDTQLNNNQYYNQALQRCDFIPQELNRFYILANLTLYHLCFNLEDQ